MMALLLLLLLAAACAADPSPPPSDPHTLFVDTLMSTISLPSTLTALLSLTPSVNNDTYSYIPTLLLSLADPALFIPSPLNIFPANFPGAADDDVLWLATTLSHRLLTKHAPNTLTQLDHKCLTYDANLQTLCCPTPTTSPPKLATPFLTALFDTHTKLLVFFDELGFPAASLKHLTAAKSLCGGHTGLEIRRATTTPTVASSATAIAEHRADLLTGVAANFSEAMIDEPGKAVEMDWTSNPASFMIGYQGGADKEALRVVADAFAERWPGLVADKVDMAAVCHRAGKIRVAFVSAFFYSHSVGRLMAQTIADLDENLFHVSIYSTGRYRLSHDDPISSIILTRADAYRPLPKSRTAAAHAIAGGAPHIVVYPELGMDHDTYYLGFTRLAPVQMVFWGHPVSQGIPSIDYFISSDLFEGGGENDRYNEQVVRMSGTTVAFSRPAPVWDALDSDAEDAMAQFAGMNVYLCSQTLMKFHPSFDAALHGITAADPDAVVVITYNSNQVMWKRVLESRIANARVVFVESMEKAKFYRLLRGAAVVLDTFPFGGGVTALETFAAGNVIVSWPGAQSVVNLVSGFYERMLGGGGASKGGMVVGSLEEYIEVAVGIATDGRRKREWVERVGEKAGLLYGDDVGGEWGDMFVGAMQRVVRPMCEDAGFDK